MSIDYLSEIEQAHLSIEDNDSPIEIDAETKEIMVPGGFITEVAVVGDHNSNAITFLCPKLIENHNILECSQKFIRWENGQYNGIFKITSDYINETERDNVPCVKITWEIDKYVTIKEGPISFSICFRDVDTDDDNNKKVVYQWSTKVCNNFSIGKGIRVTGVDFSPSEQDGEIVINTEEFDKMLEEIYQIKDGYL